MKSIFITIALLGLSTPLLASRTSDWGWGTLPIIGYDDQSGWTFGATNVIYWDSDATTNNHEVDELDLTTTVTTKQAFNVHGEFTKYFEEDTRNYVVELGYERFFNRYYGETEATEDSVLASYQTIDIPFSIGYLMKPYRNFNIRPKYELHFIRDEYTDPVTDSIANVIDLTDEDFASGLGLTIEYSTTNPGIYKYTGYKLTVGSTYFGKWLGSQHSFELFSAGYKHYVSLGTKTVLAWEAVYEQGSGDVPEFYLPTVGGNKLLRGFDSDQFKGKHRGSAQVELRFPIHKRVSGAVFIGGGNVDNRLTSLADRVRVAGGVGLRYMVQTKQKINIRFDFTYNTENDTKKYLKIKEAF